MRPGRVRFTLRRLMIGIALCAVSLAVLREAPVITLLIAQFIGPLMGSVWEVRKGKKGLIGGMVGGMVATAITWAGITLVYLVQGWPKTPASAITAGGLVFTLIVFVLATIQGAVTGLWVGIIFWALRYLATLPKQLRLRAERSSRANFYRPSPRAR